MSEEWRSVSGYKGLYEVSNLGRVRSMDRLVNHFRAGPIIRRGKILKSAPVRGGYVAVGLHKDMHQRSFSVHRIVAIAFLPNPENKPQVNHKNGVVDDNRLENLEWCTASENNLHAFRVLGRKPLRGALNHASKPVIMMSMSRVFLREFESLRDASTKTGVNRGNIASACSGKRLSAGGFTWRNK